MKTKLLLALGFALSMNCFSQNTSIVVKKGRHCPSSKPSSQYEISFEKMLESYEAKQFSNSKKTATVYNIPIIFHVIHNGESVGSSLTAPTRNLNAAFINSQIATLNADYRKTNSDFSTYVKQSSFINISADIEINFCAAKVSPTGAILAEPGIDRVLASSKNLTGTAWDMSYIETDVKPATSWDPTKYYNVFVLEFGGADVGTLGYAQFPTVSSASTPVIGDIAGTGGDANTDGVALDWHYTGVNDNGTYDKGRTLSHETGHWLGLYHIWGDDTDCSGTDNVADTPNQEIENYTCPATDGAVVTDACSTTAPGANYQNFMDYSDDRCMAMFTAGQKARMQAVMANCPRRLSLNTSTVCSIPASIHENITELEIGLFPNPSNGEINIAISVLKPQNFTINISNTLGQNVKTLIQNNFISGTIQLDLSTYNKGIYFVTITSETHSTTKRFILQ
jgi:hypothetical protein